MKLRQLVGRLPKQFTGDAEKDIRALVGALATIFRASDELTPRQGSWTPTVGSGSGTITTSNATGNFVRYGDMYFIRVGITITTNGTGGASVSFTLPFNASSIFTFYGRENAGGKQLQGIVSASSNVVTVLNYDNTYPGADGAQLYINGFVS